MFFVVRAVVADRRVALRKRWAATIQQSNLRRRDARSRRTVRTAVARARIALSAFSSETVSAMTYCVAMRLDEGLVFLADSRTNAGIDHVSTFRKLTVYERPGDRVIVLMTSGNLAAGQAVRQLVAETQRRRRRQHLEREEPVRRRPHRRRRGAQGPCARRAGARGRGPRIHDEHHRRRPDRQRALPAVPRLLGRQLHRGDGREPVLPDRRVEVRQAGARPDDHAEVVAGGRREVRAGVDGLDDALEPVGRAAARPAVSTRSIDSPSRASR